MGPASPHNILKPPALRPGDVVGIVAPASPVEPEMLEAGCNALRRMGYKPFYLPGILEQESFFAGCAGRRARELEEMFAREEVRAVVAARGGYGCNYLLPELDAGLIRRHPKIFVGYSDITALLTWLCDNGQVTFHGPMVAKDFARHEGIDDGSWSSATGGAAAWEMDALSGALPLLEGTGEGLLYGGCLSILVASLGTPYEIQSSGKLLFLEDVAAKSYQIDRMLMQLKLAGKLQDLRGIVFGEMIDCGTAGEMSRWLPEMARRVLGTLGVPVAYGLRSGHVSSRNITLPLGVRARLNVTHQVRLQILEAATADSSAVSRRGAQR